MKEKGNLPSWEIQRDGRLEEMFAGIVPWYDFLNRCLSLRRDVYWRRELVQGLSLPPRPLILDLAAGTLDVSLEMLRQHSQARVAAADFSLPMLRQGQEKLNRQGQGGIFPIAGDALALPFLPATFDALTIAFGVRNLPDRPAALMEMRRVLKPGGMLAILEFIPPERGWLQKAYELYLTRLLPWVGRVFSRHAYAYAYLAESIKNFPTAGAFCRELQEAGFREVRQRRLTCGVVSLFYGEKR